LSRRLGQHFLIRQSILERLARAICPNHEPLVIEIGPGRGALTRHLLERAERVIAVELDARLEKHLRSRFGADGRLEMVLGDILEIDLSRWGVAAIAGNLPYYITSPILSRVLALGEQMRRGVFLVQREVAERIVAVPGTRNYGYLSVKVQFLTTAEWLFAVPPAAFQPPPEVTSAAVRLVPRDPRAAFGVADTAGFLEFAARCFCHKRKTLRNNLMSAYSRDLIERWPEASLRAEQLSIEQLVGLYRRL
jgi:16S rRNA (adenine1518-N6/adenine1519-N6)-dimethyltransferase